MPNTFASALVVDVARETGITILQNKLTALRSFSKDFSTDVLAPKKNVQVPKVTAGSTAIIDPTNFETGGSTIDHIPVTVHELTVPFTLSITDLQQGFRLESV